MPLQSNVDLAGIRQLLDDLPVGVFCTNQSGDFVYINKTFAALLGYSQAESRTMQAKEIYRDPRQREAWRELLERNETHRTWLEWKRKDGQFLWVKNHAHFIRLAGNQPAYVGVVESASPSLAESFSHEGVWKERELLSAESNEFFDSLPICVAYKDSEGFIRWANQIFCHVEIGCTQSEFKQMHLTDYDLYPKELAARYQAADDVVLSTGIVLEYTEPHIHVRTVGAPPGHGPQPRSWATADSPDRIQVRVAKMPVRNETNEVCGVLCWFWEISEESFALQSTLQRIQQHAVVSQSTFRIVYEHDLQGRFTKLNEDGQRLTGYSEATFARLKVEDIVAPPYRTLVRQMIESKAKGDDYNTVTKYQIEIIHASDDETIPLELVTVLVRESGRPPYIRGYARDLRGDRAAAAHAEHVMAGFLTRLVEIIERELQEIGTPEVLQSLQRIVRSIQTAAISIKRESRTNPSASLGASEEIHRCIRELREVYQVTEDAVEIRVDCPTDLLLPGAALNDCLRLASELLTNCFKHAFPAGRPGLIVVRLVSRGKRHLEISVEDNGVGLRLPAPEGRRGLKIIVKGIAEKYGGGYEIISPMAGAPNGTKIAVTNLRF